MKKLIMGISAVMSVSMLLSFTAAAESRMISAGSSVTELFFALNAQDNLVAVDVTSKHFNKQGKFAQLGYHRQLSAEGLMALDPAYLIGSDEMGPKSTLDLLTASNVKVITVPSGNTLADLNKRIDVIAELTNSQVQAKQVKQQAKQAILALKKSIPLTAKPSVLFLMISKGRAATAAGSNTSIDEIITLSGAVNPANRVIESYKPLSYEAIIQLQPDYILVSDRDFSAYGSADKLLADFPLLKATPAGSKGQIVAVQGSALIGGFGLESIALAKTLQLHYSQLQSQSQPQPQPQSQYQAKVKD